MRVMVTGSRDWTDGETIEWALERYSWEDKLTLVVGTAKGADLIARDIARRRDWPMEVFHAAWERYGKAAGPLRNLDMLNTKPDIVLAFRLGGEESRGTTHAVNAARKQGVPVILFDYPRP
jgi:hypothetical protein